MLYVDPREPPSNKIRFGQHERPIKKTTFLESELWKTENNTRKIKFLSLELIANHF